MNRKTTFLAFLVALLFALVSSWPVLAGGKTYVHSYTRKDGTHVAAHYRASPKSTVHSAPKASHSRHAFTHSSRAHHPPKVTSGNGHHKRSAAAKRDFMRMTGYPHGRPGYVVDHIIPLCKGGADSPSNLQWQDVAAAKAKDKIECR